MDIVLKNYVIQYLLNLLDLTIFILCTITEAHIFLHKRDQSTYHLLPISFILLLLALRSFPSASKKTYLVDFTGLKPSPRLRVPTAFFVEHISLIDCFPEESVAFMTKIIASSGLGEETYFPPSLHYIPPATRHRDSIDEARMLLFPVLDDLLAKTNLSASDIDILVLNCSGFCPVPSLSSIIVNRYSMREDVRTFNISGMGCSAGAIGIDVTRNLLKVHPSSYAVVISTEILSTGWYAGRDRRKLLLNCFFRMGSSAILLTNRREEKLRAKYKLVHLQRTQRAFDDRAYHSALREEDAEGITGFSIEQHLLRIAAETLRSNLVPLGAVILPLQDKLRYGATYVYEFLWWNSSSNNDKKNELSRVVPDFGPAIRHYCLPASGRAVIEEIGKGLGLGRGDMEAALTTFRRFGNQSSASAWYQLAYIEAAKRGGVRKGERVLQLGMGSGPKCNSVVWESLRSLTGAAEGGPWFDCAACPSM